MPTATLCVAPLTQTVGESPMNIRFALLLILVMVIAALSPPIPGTASVHLSPDPQVLLSTPAPKGSTRPRLAPPAQPLRAWSIAPDGAVFVLDQNGRLYELAEALLTPVGRSAPLRWVQDKIPVYLLADEERLFVSSTAISQTLVLDRTDFHTLARLPQAGPMALDPGRQLVLIAQTRPDPRPYHGLILVYDLAALRQPPRTLETGCLSGPPVADPVGRRLWVQERNCQSSPPHQGDAYRIYDLDTLEALAHFQPDPFRGQLEPPAVATEAGVAVTVNHGLNGNDDLYLVDATGQTVRSQKNILPATAPLVDATGEWLYLQYGRGLAILHAADLSLQSFLPFTQTTPSALALSPDNGWLYLIGDDQWMALPTTHLQQLGVQPLQPFPTAWLQPANNGPTLQPAFYPSPAMGQEGVAFLRLLPANGAVGELYRSADGGHSWHPLPVARGADLALLSLSPEFATDQTLVTAYRRSTDGGEHWRPWSPRLAFVSEQHGNRDLYAMDEFGQARQQLTAHPAADENPAWSPGWTRLAFQSNRSSNWDIFTLRADCDPPQPDCDLRQLTNDPADDLLPAWSPDGQTIAFVSTRDGNAELYLMDKDGSNQRRLTFHPGGDWRPAWLPDSRHLLFTSDRGGNNDIYRVAIPASPQPLLAEPPLTLVVTGPADDRDPAVGISSSLADRFGFAGSQLFFFLSDRDGVMKSYITASDGSTTLAFPYRQGDQPEAHPSWFKEDTLLVARGEGGASEIYAFTPYGEPRQLTAWPGFDGHPAGGPVWWQPDALGTRFE
jgi:hypothetical protein